MHKTLAREKPHPPKSNVFYNLKDYNTLAMHVLTGAHHHNLNLTRLRLRLREMSSSSSLAN